MSSAEAKFVFVIPFQKFVIIKWDMATNAKGPKEGGPGV
jgi:hypothetical protein